MSSPVNNSRNAVVHGLRVGQSVRVNDRSGWLTARVITLDHRLVGVQFTADMPVRRYPFVPPWVVRPASGVCLRRAAHLAPGDTILTFTGELKTVAAAPRACDDLCVIDFTEGAHLAVSGRSLLRLHSRSSSRPA